MNHFLVKFLLVSGGLTCFTIGGVASRRRFRSKASVTECRRCEVYTGASVLFDQSLYEVKSRVDLKYKQSKCAYD